MSVMLAIPFVAWSYLERWVSHRDVPVYEHQRKEKMKDRITDFMASTADPSQRCQAHFAGGMYNMIKSCNMGKVSVQYSSMSINKLHRQVKAYPIPLYLRSET